MEINRFGSVKKKEGVEFEDDPLMTERDLAYTVNVLDIIIRKLIIERKLTRHQFTRLYIQYNTEVLKMHYTNAKDGKDNLWRSVAKGNITWYKFNCMLAVLGVSVTGITVQEKDKPERRFNLTMKTDRY